MTGIAKWSVVALVAVGILAHIAINTRGPARDGATTFGVIIGLLLRAWIIIAVVMWWPT